MKKLVIACSMLALAGSSQAQTTPTPVATAAPAAPSAKTLALARKVADRDDFLTMIRGAAGDESAKTVKGLGNLTPDQKTKADAIAKAKVDAGMDKIADLLATVYAQKFTPKQLRQMDAFLETPTGIAYSERLMTILTALKGLQNFDLHKDTVAATCTEIGKGCPQKPASSSPSGTK